MESSPYRCFFSFAKTTHGYARVDAVGITKRENERVKERERENGEGKIVSRRERNCLE